MTRRRQPCRCKESEAITAAVSETAPKKVRSVKRSKKKGGAGLGAKQRSLADPAGHMRGQTGVRDTMGSFFTFRRRPVGHPEGPTSVPLFCRQARAKETPHRSKQPMGFRRPLPNERKHLSWAEQSTVSYAALSVTRLAGCGLPRTALWILRKACECGDSTETMLKCPQEEFKKKKNDSTTLTEALTPLWYRSRHVPRYANATHFGDTPLGR